MSYLTFVYNGSGRDLKKVITAILKSGLATRIQKINYGQTFSLQEKNVKKSEMKMLLIQAVDEEKLMNFLGKNFPQIERIFLH